MLINKKGLVYFALTIKVMWVALIFFYSPLILTFSFLATFFGLILFAKQHLFKILLIGLFGWSFDCVLQSIGLVSFANSQLILDQIYLPLWILPLWLNLSVFLVVIFHKYTKQYLVIIPIFSSLNFINYVIAMQVSSSFIQNEIYYLFAFLSWVIVGFIAFNINRVFKFISPNKFNKNIPIQ